MFTEDEIYDLERHFVEEGGFAMGLDKIQEDEENEKVEDDESFPMSTPSTSRMEVESQSIVQKVEARPQWTSGLDPLPL